MTTPRQITLHVGNRELWGAVLHVNPAQYIPDSVSLLRFVRSIVDNNAAVQNFATINADVVRAFCLLHKRRELDCTNVIHCPTGQLIHVDVNGDFIEPWPDEFFEIGFHLVFSESLA
jgi:hypothetical protein